MTPEKSPELTVQTLMTLRKENDALRVVTERLKVKEMGPSDHIRTKHEAKLFIESGDQGMAELLLKRAGERRSQNLAIKAKISLRRGMHLGE